MAKSYEKGTLGVVRGILADAMQCYPHLHREFERDYARLSKGVDTRGLSVLTLDLPALGKHLDRCLSDTIWSEPHLPFSRRAGPRTVIPRLFGGLLRMVFHPNGVLRDDLDVNAIAFLRQLYAVAKKVKIDCDPSRTFGAIREFYEIESSLPPPSLDWNGDGFVAEDASLLSFEDYDPLRHPDNLFSSTRQELRTSIFLRNLQTIADYGAWALGMFDPEAHSPKHGPGAVSDLSGREFKFTFPFWSDRLERVFPYDEFAFANYDHWIDAVTDEKVASSIEPMAKLIVVPKTQKSPRLIAAEPTSHQWCQQIIWSYFRARYQASTLGEFVSFGDQTRNQILAKRASIQGSHCTVDLSSASDRLTCKFVERLFRRNPFLLEALYSSRTRYLRQDIDKKSPPLCRLKKFSTMGSACTFPVQSHAFLMIALSAVITVRGLPPTPRSVADLVGEVRVFGDDIIVPDDAGSLLCEALGNLDFKVNQSKTYRIGRFRESCGLEAYAGVDVTPAYFLRPPEATKPETVVSALEASNNLHSKGFWNAAEAVRRTLPQGLSIPVVGPVSGAMGVRSFVGTSLDSMRTRWSNELQRIEVRTTVASAKVTWVDPSHHGQLFQFFLEDPASKRGPGPLAQGLQWRSGYADRPRTRLVRRWVDQSELACS